jgi:hypothetical protein
LIWHLAMLRVHAYFQEIMWVISIRKKWAIKGFMKIIDSIRWALYWIVPYEVMVLTPLYMKSTVIIGDRCERVTLDVHTGSPISHIFSNRQAYRSFGIAFHQTAGIGFGDASTPIFRNNKSKD